MTELPGEPGVRQGCVGEMETLGISLLMGTVPEFHPLCFVPGNWLNLLLVPEEGPSAVTKCLSVRRRCHLPMAGPAQVGQNQPRWGRASPGGAEQPSGPGGRAGSAEPPPPLFSLCNRIKKSLAKPGFGFISYLRVRTSLTWCELDGCRGQECNRH